MKRYIVKWRAVHPDDSYDPYSISSLFTRKFSTLKDAVELLWQVDWQFRDDAKYLNITVQEDRDLNGEELSVVNAIYEILKDKQKTFERQEKERIEENKRQQEYDLYLQLKKKFE